MNNNNFHLFSYIHLGCWVLLAKFHNNHAGCLQYKFMVSNSNLTSKQFHHFFDQLEPTNGIISTETNVEAYKIEISSQLLNTKFAKIAIILSILYLFQLKANMPPVT